MASYAPESLGHFPSHDKAFLVSYRLTARDICALLCNEEWIAREFRNAKLVFVDEFARTECGITFYTTLLSERFKFTYSRMRAICVNVQRK
jgi:hypothetical protein